MVKLKQSDVFLSRGPCSFILLQGRKTSAILCALRERFPPPPPPPAPAPD